MTEKAKILRGAAILCTAFSFSVFADSMQYVADGSIDVTVGDKTGKIILKNAYYKRLDPSDYSSDIIIVYSNSANSASCTGSLKLGDDGGTDIWANAHVLAVGGGGGGGFVGNTSRVNHAGGGGGAGGFVERSGLVFDGTDTYAITVGAGGAGSETHQVAGTNGGDTSIKFASNSGNVVDVAKGGGGGGANSNGLSGGSGGGASLNKKTGGAGVSGQGFAGGNAATTYRGAGGGGAGNVGSNAVSSVSGKNVGGAPGGIGKSSLITGEELWFAGGGGGSFLNVNNKTSAKYRGGDGGKGGGGNGGGVLSGDAAEWIDGYWTGSVAEDEFIVLAPGNGADGTGGGGGGGGCYGNSTASNAATTVPDTNYGGRGGSGIVIIRLSGFVVGTVSYPVPSDFVYNGAEQQTVKEYFPYTLGGDWKATDSGVYSFSATIADSDPYTWDDGTKGAKSFTWKIKPLPVQVPVARKDLVFGDATRTRPEEKVAIDVDYYSLDADDCCYTVDSLKLKYCRLSGHRQMNAGEYAFVASLYTTTKNVGAETVPVTNFIWKVDPVTTTIEDQNVSWKIKQAENSISSLELGNWQEGLESLVPTCSWQWDDISSDEVVYTFAKSDKKPLFDSDYDIEEMPSEAGVYWVRAHICKDSATEPGNWVEANAYKRFCIWRHPSKVYADYVDITVSGYNGGTTKLTDFPVPVRLKEAVRNSSGAISGGIPGFRYASIFSSSEIRFVAISNVAESAVAPADRSNPLSRDLLLPFEVDTWNTKGESLVWVKVPAVSQKTTKFRMYWNRRSGEEARADLLASDTWNEDYVAVWHFGSKNGDRIPNSTSIGALLDATGAVQFVSAEAGKAAYVKSANIVVPDYSEYLDKSGEQFVSGLYKFPDYKTGTFMFLGKKLGGQADNPQQYESGWCVAVTQTTKARVYGAGNAYSSDLTLPDITKNWNMISLYSPQNEASEKRLYRNGESSAAQKSLEFVTNDLPFQVAGTGVQVDELRISKNERSTAWMKAEYDSIVNDTFCTFGLVNQLQSDGVTRAWVNYWTEEPSVKEFVEIGEFKSSDVKTGSLRYGTVAVSYTKMPEETPCDFDFVNDNTGPYIVSFRMAEEESGTPGFPGRHTYFDGARDLDLEIIKLREVAIDPNGDGATASGRVLLGNDDYNAADPVTNQSYWVWEHIDGFVGVGLEGVNVLPGTEHKLAVRGGASAWHLKDVFIGNIMANDNSGNLPASSTPLVTLPYSSTSRNTVSNESYNAELRPNEVGHFLMRNIGGATYQNSGAQIVSPAYTNGIGTIYFDAVNSSVTNSAAFELIVEVSTNLTDGVGEEWTRLENIVQLKVEGSKVSSPVTNATIELDVATGGNSRFRRIFIPVNRTGPMRFRIRRTSELAQIDNGEAVPDDIHAFIVIDNIIASPAPLDMSLLPYGWLDETKTGNRVLGVETAFNDKYPTASETNLYARAKLGDDAVLPFITSARCLYRWRYLDSNFDPLQQLVDNDYRPVFKTMYLDTANGLKGIRPFELNGLPGDIEFYFKATAVVPYYVYVDYSGSAAVANPLGGYYSEHIPEGIVSRRSGKMLSSRGEDWFVRLREGESPYSSIRIYARGSETAQTDMVLMGDHLWRGFLRTRAANPDGIEYRFEALLPDMPGASKAHYTTNYWKGSGDSLTLPHSPIIAEGGTNEWSKIPCDATTGYIMFQLDDRTGSLTISHADYQNFNAWSDAWSNDGMFSGSSIELGKRTGVSGKMMRYAEDFSTWTDTPPTNSYWTEVFNGELDGSYPGFVSFDASATPNGWSAANGMWVGRFYHPIDKDSRAYSKMALQLSGTERGYLELINSPKPPRGIDKVSFKARVGQRIDFDAFSYADLGLANATNECTFVTRVTFDENENRNYAGAPVASLVINYQPGVGGYEARLEQLKGNSGGIDTFSHKLSLYRWAADEDENIVCTLLGSITNNVEKNFHWGGKDYKVNFSGNNRSSIPKTTDKAAGRRFLPFMISAKTLEDGTTEVTAGVWCSKDQDQLMKPSDTDYAAKNWNLVHYRDSSANHPVRGYYGVQSANSEVYFNQPATFGTAVKLTDSTWTKNLSYARNEFACAAGQKLVFGDGYATERDNILFGAWTSGKNRHSKMVKSDTEFGIKAVSPSVKLDLYLGSSNGQAATEKFGTRVIDGFGSIDSEGKEYSFEVRSVNNRSVKLSAAKSALGDVVLTDVTITQWAGDTYGETGGDTLGFVNYDDGYGFRTNVVFTSGIIDGNKVKLSARRTKAGYPSSIRSPLFDGEYSDGVRRGLGLGMMSFTYENAQTNVNLLIQIATNRVSTDIRALTRSVISDSSAGAWTTVTNVDFSVMSAEERRKGSFGYYFGLHGVKGLMRIVIDPKVVEEAANATDEKLFGEIDITRFICRDEPDLDNSDWWGWNMRTLSHGSEYDGGMRTYLPDGDVDAFAAGMSLALNNSVSDMVDVDDVPVMDEHMPFVQTPTFVSNIVGEISFRARKYDAAAGSQNGEIQLYGATSGLEGSDESWTPLHRFVISNSTYATYSFRAASTYSAFRLGVVGVDGVTYHHGEERETSPAARVLIDEIMVFEAVRPTMGFRYIYPFREGLDVLSVCTNVVDARGYPLPDAQPVAGEDWTVQAEIEKRQLPDEIDLVTHKPEVVFYWYSGGKWGFSNWREDAIRNGTYGKLTRADGEELIFRGSLAAPVPALVMATTEPPEVVQYSAEIIYRSVSGEIQTNQLTNAEWKCPEWYRPLDLNSRYAKWNSFSAYTIIDTIAPGRVWINEANIFDNRSDNWVYFADTNQYVEVAAPERQSLDGWRLEYVANDYKVHTLCEFSGTEKGNGYVAATKDLSRVPAGELQNYRTNDYVFLTVRSPNAKASGAWDSKPGAIDGTWADFDQDDTTLNQDLPIALRLVRSNGIVEQEIALEGTNTWANGRYAAHYSATNWIAKATGVSAGKLYLVGNEYGSGNGDSLGVVSGTGSVSNDWSKYMAQSPGRINDGQIIPEGFVVYPNGAMMVVRARIGAAGHVEHAFGSDAPSNLEIVTFIKKGSEGTNITYSVAPWWEMGSVTTNGVAHGGATAKRGSFTINVGAGESNDVLVVATARPYSELADAYGLTADNRYTPAVMEWLEQGRNYFGKEFANPGSIVLSEYCKLDGEKIRDLSLTEMYWLDIDPTTNWILKAAVSGVGGPIVLDDIPPVVTNFRMTVHMEITNKFTNVAYSPYILRGVEPGSTSFGASSWTSVTFKITGDLQGGPEGRARWLPLRWFVFAPDESKKNLSASFDDNHEAVVDVWDPKDEYNAVWTKGWSAYPDPVWYCWGLNDFNAPVEIETLLPDSRYSE